MDICNETGKPLLHIRFPDTGNWKRLLGKQQPDRNNVSASVGASAGASVDIVDESAFGVQYEFQLFDSENAAAVNAPEW